MSTQVTSPTHAEAQAPRRFHYSLAQVALAQSDLTTIGQYMFWLMFRNVASDGLVFESPATSHRPRSSRCRGAYSPRRRGRTPART